MALSGTNYLPFPVETSDRGGIGVPIYIQDQTTGPLDLLFLREINATTLAANTVVGSRTLTLSPGHGAVIGNTLELADNTVGAYFMQSVITNVVANTITLSSPINRVYTTSNTSVVVSSANMNVNGSVTPVIFSVNPLPVQSGDMVRVIVSMTDNTGMDFSTFGGISGGLANGVVLRVNNGDGTYRNLANFKTNGDIELYSYDARYFENIGGATRGFSARMTWGGQDKHGVVIRLDGALGEKLEIIVQDDLTSLINMRWIAQGSELQGN